MWPILVRDGRAQELKIDGTPLGIFPDLDYEILEFATQPQDIFVFASDGVLESMNAHEEQFGFERLAETLRTVRPDMSFRHIVRLYWRRLTNSVAGQRSPTMTAHSSYCGSIE